MHLGWPQLSKSFILGLSAGNRQSVNRESPWMAKVKLMLKFLPAFLREPLKKRENLRNIFANTGWLVFEHVFRMGVGLLVSILVARYLGPEKYGILRYAVSVIAFMSTFIYLGLGGLVVRGIVRKPEDKNDILGTTFSLKFVGAFLAFLAVLGVALSVHGYGESEFWVLLIIGLSLFASPFETIDYWFQSQVQSKYTVYAKSSAFILGEALKVSFVFLGASVIAFAAANSLQVILASILLVLIYHYKGFSVFQWKAKISKAKELLSESWILILAGFLAMINLKVDQIMLRWMVDAKEVGLYSVAVNFSEVWYFIPTAITMSVYPRMIELKKLQTSAYNKRLQQVFDVLFVISFIVAVAMTFVAGPLIPFLYGEAYTETSSILVIHVWAGIFMFMRAMFSKWVFIEDALYFSLISHGVGALVNVLINLVLIPRFGGQGAAIATLFSYAASSYFFLFLYSKTRPLAVQMSKAFLFPLRLIVYRNKIWAQ